MVKVRHLRDGIGQKFDCEKSHALLGIKGFTFHIIGFIYTKINLAMVSRTK